MDDINLEVVDRLATVTINRPAQRNSMTLAMWREMARLFERLSADSEVRGIVLTVGHPDVAVAIDVHPVREDEHALGEARNQLARRVELEDRWEGGHLARRAIETRIRATALADPDAPAVAIDLDRATLEHIPGASSFRLRLAALARELGDWSTALEALEYAAQILVPGNHDWDCMVAATVLGRWDSVRAAAKRLDLELPDGEGPVELDLGVIRCEFIEASGTTPVQAEGRKLTFEPVKTLEPNQKASWTVRVKANAVGDVRNEVELTSDYLTSPVPEQEPTRIIQ